MEEKLKQAFQESWDGAIAAVPDLTVGLILFTIIVFLGWGLSKLVRRRLAHYTDDVLLVNFVSRAIWLIVLLFGIYVFLNQIGLGDAAGGILAGAGVGALILGFAFKDIGENFIAGFFLAFSRPFGTGDIIEVIGNSGTVKSMDFRNTHIRTFTGQDIFLPNALIIKNPLINYTRDGLLRHDFTIGLDYEDDMTGAIDAIMEELGENGNIVHDGDLAPFVVIQEFGTSTINLKVHFWINTKDFLGSMTVLKSKIMAKVFLRLKSDGFYMPADIVELKIYQDGNPIPLSISRNELEEGL